MPLSNSAARSFPCRTDFDSVLTESTPPCSAKDIRRLVGSSFVAKARGKQLKAAPRLAFL